MGTGIGLSGGRLTESLEVPGGIENALFTNRRIIHIFFEEEDVDFPRLDLVVLDEIVMELNDVKPLEDNQYAQVKSYLKATGIPLNYNFPTLVVKRAVH